MVNVHSRGKRGRNSTRRILRTLLTSNELRLGFFENLTQYCELGFSRSVNDVYKRLLDSDSILLWDDRILACLKSCSKNRGSELSNGQLHLVGYLFECCYDLAISPSRNISQDPDFCWAIKWWWLVFSVRVRGLFYWCSMLTYKNQGSRESGRCLLATLILAW